MTKTKIEWTDEVWNPVTGCSKVSHGCKNCYAERVFSRPYPGRAFTDVRTHPERLDAPLRWRKPRRVFVNSMSDLFHEDVPEAFIDQVFAVMALAPQHTFQVLTKRPERMLAYLANPIPNRGWPSGVTRDLPRQWFIGACMRGHTMAQIAHWQPASWHHNFAGDRGSRLQHDWPGMWPLPNVWLGVSVEDQETADHRIPLLLRTPAALRFVSCEPLLGLIELDSLPSVSGIGRHLDALSNAGCEDSDVPAKLDWVIAGGESGPHARPSHPAWFRSLRDQCDEAAVPFFFKQWGEWAPNIGAVDGWQINDDPETSRFDHTEWEDGRWSEIFRPAWSDFAFGNYDEDQCVSRLGKKTAGRMLDGREHLEYPA